jgi:hypothetical protein
MPQAVLSARPGRPFVPVVMGTVNINSAGGYPSYRKTLTFVVHQRLVETLNLNKPFYRIQVKKTPAKKQERRKQKKDNLKKVRV